ncbi:hypothetical protein SERLA73DRAFT_176964 [Serpula lacrymans var. lacrymans S7.3]|uniref:HBS1-like protein N-terminal domain-containing protein n=1 Tax=Serpula lacrymans var. lacrymans (strain S7.3) TaxID=936435 RepID=F8PQM7_SERL3|nr:hypothetical protein SERLA73DRAFT_176964 [Serpula lacrymans var. lacrymans S7.3]
MSRHRLVRNLDLNDELDDDALSDGGEDEMTVEQQAQMAEGLDHVRAVMGAEDVSGLDDETIRGALWELYFDVQKTIDWLLEEQERRIAARERKAQRASKELPPLPYDQQGNEYVTEYDEYQPPEFIPLRGEYEYDEDGRPRVPLIVLAQQGHYQDYQPEGYPEEYPEDYTESARSYTCALSTITERTERTEASSRWPNKQQLMALNNPRAPSSTGTSTSYGQYNATSSTTDFGEELERPLDPNEIPPSPSPSAVKRLSKFDPAPSVATSESRSMSPMLPSYMPSKPVTFSPLAQPISEVHGKKSNQFANPPASPPSSGTAKKSKLSMLASSRASTATRHSTLSDSETSSVITYPALRPAPESTLSLAPKVTPSSKSSSTSPSSTSSLVRRAIQSALELEALDRDTPKDNHKSLSTASSASSKTVKPSKPPSTNPQSPPRAVDPVLPVAKTDHQNKVRQPSKLAMLAQAKANAHQGPRMPKSGPPKSPPRELPNSHTEYLTPIANGSTVTTAITTSYQSLYSLSSTTRSSDQPVVVPLSNFQQPEKQSKLAMKIKKAHEKPSSQSSVTEEDSGVVYTPPMFVPKYTRSHKDTHRTLKDRSSESKQTKVLRDPRSQIRRTSDPSRPKKDRPKTTPPELGTRTGFAFDTPSPDDIVYSARRGTTLAQRR